MNGTLGAAGGEDRRRLLAPFLSSWSGRVASERIIDTLESILEEHSELPQQPLGDRLQGWQRATRRRLIKRFKGYLPGSKYRPEFQRHRYPGLTLDEMRERVTRFQQLLGDSKPLRVDRLGDHIFRIAD